MFQSALSSFKYNMRITEHQSNKKVTLQALFCFVLYLFQIILKSVSLHFRSDDSGVALYI